MSGTRAQRKVLISDVVEWRRLYEQEARSLSQIAALYGRPVVTVHRSLKIVGVEMRPRGRNLYRHPISIPDAEIDQAVAYYKQGHSAEEVAAKMGISKGAARYRLDRAGVLRNHSDAMKISTRVRRLPREVEDAIIEAYQAGGTCVSVSRDLGVGHGSVSAVLARRGIKARRVKKQTQRRAAKQTPKPVDLERIGFVAAGPLAALLLKDAKRVLSVVGEDDSLEGVCLRAGIAPRQLYAWETREIVRARFDVADRLLIRKGRLWWEVYDPEAYGPGVFADRQRDDVLCWLDAVDTAALMWTGEPAFGSVTNSKPIARAA